LPANERDEPNPYDGHDLRGLICQRPGCGQTMRFVYTLADVGAFCSSACREQMTAEKSERRTA
jgi:hypothetical protein